MDSSWNRRERVEEDSMLPLPTVQPDELRARARRGRPKRVVVIGAGMAGLVAGYELSKLAYDVQVLEKSDRVGGRVRTVRFQHDGAVSQAEAGAMRLPANHSATLHYVREFKLATRRFVNFNWEAFYRIGDRQSSIIDWPSASPYHLPDYWRKAHPRQRFAEELQKLVMWLPRPLRVSRTADLGGVEELVQLSEISLREALRRAGNSAESIEEMGHATGMRAYMHYSALEILAEYQTGLGVDMVELLDGMDAIPRELARRLGDRVELRCKVTSVRLLPGDSVELTWQHPELGEQRRECDYVVCAAPAPDVVRDIDFTPPLPMERASAMLALTYAPASKTLVHVPERFWEQKERGQEIPILGGLTFTDEPVSQLVYPSDNADPVPEDDPDYQAVQITGTGLDRAIGVETGFYRARDAAKSLGPGVLVAYRWGTEAMLYNEAPDDETRKAMTIRAIEKIHTISVGSLLQQAEFEHVRWPQAFAHFLPGDHLKHQGRIELPYPSVKDGPIFWAGEHVGYLHGWIHSAVVTAWNAAAAIAEAPCRMS